MRGHHLDRILATTALALVLGLSIPALSQSVARRNRRVESRVPVPDTTLPPPITAVDVVKPVGLGDGDRRTHHAIDVPAALNRSGDGNACPRNGAAGTDCSTCRRSARTAEPAAAPAAPARQPAQAAPAAAPPSPDQAFSDKLRDLLAGRNAAPLFHARNERRRRSLLPRSQLRAALRRSRQAVAARRRGRRLSAECRRRRSRAFRLSGADLQGRRPRRAGRSRTCV